MNDPQRLRTSPWRRRLLISSALLTTLAGCQHDDGARPLTPAMLSAPPRTERTLSTDPLSRTDQPGLLPTDRRSETNIRRDIPKREPVEGLSQVVQDNVKPPGPGDEYPRQPTSRSTTHPTTGPTTIGVSSGQYFDIGGVVMDVNGTPIYANRVVSLLDPVFAARAKELDPQQFRSFAAHEIFNQLKALCDDQLEYAAAERFLDKKDKDLADMLTMQWRQKQINSAGGSLPIARDRATARNENFDDLVHQQYRANMIGIYYELKIKSKIQVSAAEIRDYYDQNLEREFTDPGTARFRLIKIDKSKHGGPEEAAGLLDGLRNRIVKAGEPFEAIARSVNDDPRLLKSGGDLGTPIQQHAFAVAPVDEAVWQTPAGQVTPVIEAGNALYLASVEEKKEKVVHPFDEATQSRIEYQLSNQQFRAARQIVIERLNRDAAVFTTPTMQNTALEMAMQNYPRWAGK